ncbi:hypothetical protein DPSP01_012747 [Paraphaeosphaeria sporulosa]
MLLWNSPRTGLLLLDTGGKPLGVKPRNNAAKRSKADESRPEKSVETPDTPQTTTTCAMCSIELVLGRPRVAATLGSLATIGVCICSGSRLLNLCFPTIFVATARPTI